MKKTLLFSIISLLFCDNFALSMEPDNSRVTKEASQRQPGKKMHAIVSDDDLKIQRALNWQPQIPHRQLPKNSAAFVGKKLGWENESNLHTFEVTNYKCQHNIVAFPIKWVNIQPYSPDIALSQDEANSPWRYLSANPDKTNYRVEQGLCAVLSFNIASSPHYSIKEDVFYRAHLHLNPITVFSLLRFRFQIDGIPITWNLNNKSEIQTVNDPLARRQEILRDLYYWTPKGDGCEMHEYDRSEELKKRMLAALAAPQQH